MRREDAKAEALYEPAALVRFAICAHLDAYGRDAREPRRRSARATTGRQALASALRVTPSMLPKRLTASGDALFEFARELELHGIAPHDSVTRLARIQGLGLGLWDVAPHFWPRLREGFGLGVEGEEPSFTTAHQVVMIAEAFASHHRALLANPSADAVAKLPDSEVLACRQLLGLLCRLCAGPYGVSRSSARLAAALLPLAPDDVATFVRRGGAASQLVRAFDRTDTPGGWTNETSTKFAALLADPPGKVIRRFYWLRAIRRLRLTEQGSGTSSPPDWMMIQLERATFAEGAYAGARRWEQRAAFWCAGELSDRHPRFLDLRARALDCEVLDDLVPVVDEMRSAAASVLPLHRLRWLYTPPGGWAALHRNRASVEPIDPDRSEKGTWSQRARWRWALPETRHAANQLLTDAVFGPCPARQRTALDTLRAAGAATAGSASLAIGEVMQRELNAARPKLSVVERCLYVLGHLGAQESIDLVEGYIKRPVDDLVFAQAHLAAHELVNRHPKDSHWLMGSVEQSLRGRPLDDELASIAIRAAVVARRAPEKWLTFPKPVSDSTDKMLTWAKATLDDPLLFARDPVGERAPER